MTTETQVVRETFRFVGHEPRSSFSATLRETFFIDENAFVTPSANVHEQFFVRDNYAQSAYSVLHETFRVRDQVYPKLKYSVVWRDQFYVRDEAYPSNRASVTMREKAYFKSHAISPPSGSLHEKFYARDAVHWFSTGTVALRETFRVRDAVYPHTTVVLREKAYFDDALTSRNRANEDVHEVLYVRDKAYPQVYARGDGTTLHETFYADDAAHTRVSGSGGPPLHETFYADDRAIPPASGLAFTCSIFTWGMSVYANYPFLTQANGYAAGQNLWLLNATKDHTKEISSWITTGKIDVGTSHGKRPSALYAAGSSLAPLTVTVTGDVDGVLMSFDYPLELRDQSDYRNNKAILGKGFRSRYLQFKLRTVKYTALRLLTAEVDLAASPRRVG